MSFSDLKHSLRKLEFPACAKEALLKIEQLLVGRAAPTSKQMDNAMEIISEFVFCEADRRGGRRGAGLNPLQELQLIDIICDYLSACNNETTKNTLFLSLFGGMESPRKLKILCILASMAVSASSTPVLLAVGVWLQQMGCSSPQSLQLVENIIRDHFYLNTTNQAALKSLANTAPQFVSNFITAVTELYMLDTQKPIKLPPKNLLEVITSWVYTTPTLCMSAQLNAAALPSGAIPMAAVTPLAGLVRWCALAPLYIDEDTEMDEVPVKKIKIEGDRTSKSVNKAQTESQLYIQLQLGLLQSMRAWRRRGPPAAIGAQRLAALAAPVREYSQHLIDQGCKLNSEQRLQDCLDRIGQAVQVALANGCVYGNINNLLASLESLPENRLLRIIVKTQQQII
ncbi:integrator complex subunit 15 [Battus philenor]|uniref:integrator complex subunit 15 n=1 Tax=Battus philenor TaxID=42288 RepID=UPI0035D08754